MRHRKFYNVCAVVLAVVMAISACAMGIVSYVNTDSTYEIEQDEDMAIEIIG